MAMIPVKVGTHWLKSRRSILQKVLLLVIILYVAYHHSVSSSRPNSPTSYISETASIEPYFSNDLSEEELVLGLYKKFKYDTSLNWVDIYTLNRNFLTLSMGPHRGSKLDHIDNVTFYDSDPRLSWSVYLEHLMNADSASDITIPFSWYDWADFDIYNKVLSSEKTAINCSFFYETAFDIEILQNIEEEINDFLFSTERVKYNDPRWYRSTRNAEEKRTEPLNIPPTQCKVVGDQNSRFNLRVEVQELHDSVRSEVYQLQARSHLLAKVNHPLSMTIMEKNTASYRVNIDQNTRANMVQSGILNDFVEEKLLKMGTSSLGQEDIIFDHYNTFGTFLKSNSATKYKVNIDGVDRESQDQDLIHLDPADFEVDVRAIIKELENLKASTGLSAHDQQYLESLQYSINVPPALAAKYLSEAGNIAQLSGMGYHRDKRFFNGGLIQEPEEYQLRLNALIRNWLKFSKANGFITWLAHGTMYGHLFNGKNFPWDNDYDVQMPIRHLHLLSRYFNQSLILEDPREGNGRFLLDVGTSITVRTKGNGYNNIDARFIDIDSGLYVDITGMSVSSNPLRQNFGAWYKENSIKVDLQEGMKNFDYPEVGDGLAALNIDELRQYVDDHKSEFSSEEIKRVVEVQNLEKEANIMETYPERNLTPKERYFMNRELKLYNCRNNHFVSMESLSPLINSVYHGELALVPHNIIDILKKEYAVQPNFGFLVYEGKVFLPALRFWFNFNVLKRFANVNNWNPALDQLESPINDLKVYDMLPLYKNMLRLGYDDLFAMFYTSFNATAYRWKEIEIQYDPSTDKDEKWRLLHILRTEVAPKLSSPGKDPYLYNYERKLWRNLSMHMDKEAIQKIQETVGTEVLYHLMSATVSLHEKKSALFRVTNSTGEVIHDLNLSGMDIVTANTLFSSDPPI